MDLKERGCGLDDQLSECCLVKMDPDELS